jgi:TRAP-type C4-dicarboxylate transport system permease small subunit
MRTVVHWLRARAENVAAALLAALFLTFLLQIFTRYVISLPLGWTVELCLTLWLWLIFWSAAFVLRDRDHVRFDGLYHWAGARLRRVLAGLSALALVASFALAFPATYDYVSFYKIKRSTTMGLRLDLVFGVYLFFAAAMIIYYGVRLAKVLRGRPLADEHPDVPTA